MVADYPYQTVSQADAPPPEDLRKLQIKVVMRGIQNSAIPRERVVPGVYF
jgi:hypothetical protein